MFAALSAACGGAIDAQPIGDAGPDTSDQADSSGQPCRTTNLPDGGGGSCSWSVDLVGDLSTCPFPMDGGAIPADVCNKLCGPTNTKAPTTVCYRDTAYNPTKLRCGQGCMGRLPSMLEPRTLVRSATVADYFVDMAFLEAASIDAFYILHDELAAHDAPTTLLRQSAKSAQDEIRHAHATAAIAARFGGIVEPPMVERGPTRSLLAIAIENAIEGCVHETWGAMVAAWQADHAEPSLRATFQTIAKDEADHALLGWKIATWADRKLSISDRSTVERARQHAVDNLLAKLAIEPDDALVTIAGLPRAAQALTMARSLFERLEAQAA